MGMENYSWKLVKRLCREKEKQEWVSSHTSITSKIKYFLLLSYAGNKRLKVVVAVVDFIMQSICLLRLAISAKNWFGCF